MNVLDTVENANYELASKLNSAKRTLKSCIDMEKLVTKIKDIINESENFDFRSKRAERFIDINSPSFILSCKLLPDKKDLKNNNIRISSDKISKLTDDITKLVNLEITEKISEFLTDCILDEEKYNNLFKNLPDEFSNTFLTQIYIVRISVADNSVVVKIFQ